MSATTSLLRFLLGSMLPEDQGNSLSALTALNMNSSNRRAFVSCQSADEHRQLPISSFTA
jgi:hypothetical protein